YFTDIDAILERLVNSPAVDGAKRQTPAPRAGGAALQLNLIALLRNGTLEIGQVISRPNRRTRGPSRAVAEQARLRNPGAGLTPAFASYGKPWNEGHITLRPAAAGSSACVEMCSSRRDFRGHRLLVLFQPWQDLPGQQREAVHGVLVIEEAALRH